MNNKTWLAEVQWNEEGLIPAIVQCHRTKRVLMLAWMNSESLSLSIKERRTVFWSRSRRQLWYKGETSGSVQLIKELFLDCDGDCVLIEVEQKGPGACHTGKLSCFFRQYINNKGWMTYET